MMQMPRSSVDRGFDTGSPRNAGMTHLVADIDVSRVFLPSRLPILLPDGTRWNQDALLVGPCEYSFAFIEDGLAAMIDNLRLRSEIMWAFEDGGLQRAVGLALRQEGDA